MPLEVKVDQLALFLGYAMKKVCRAFGMHLIAKLVG